LSSPQSTLGWKLPPVSLAGMWLEEAGFEVGDFARIVVYGRSAGGELRAITRK